MSCWGVNLTGLGQEFPDHSRAQGLAAIARGGDRHCPDATPELQRLQGGLTARHPRREARSAANDLASQRGERKNPGLTDALKSRKRMSFGAVHIRQCRWPAT
jgi:hypothetical protein